MSVPKSRRGQSVFETTHSLRKLRIELTDLASRNFGLSETKKQKLIEVQKRSFQSSPNADQLLEAYRKRMTEFYQALIAEERQYILDILRKMTTEFTLANSIYPSGPTQEMIFAEYKTRRLHLDAAIGYCVNLEQEIQYLSEVMPVNINQYETLSNMIDRQLALFKGVRQSDNRFIRPSKSAEENKNSSGTSTPDAAPGSTTIISSSQPSITIEDMIQASSNLPPIDRPPRYTPANIHPIKVPTSGITQSHFTPAPVTRIKTFQDARRERNEREQRYRTPNTSKMNTTRFVPPATEMLNPYSNPPATTNSRNLATSTNTTNPVEELPKPHGFYSAFPNGKIDP